MFFLLRALFWIGVVMLFLPMPRSAPTGTARTAQPPAAAALAGSAAASAASFCLKRPDTCRSGAETAQRFGLNVERSARLISDLLAANEPAPAAPKPPRPAGKARAAAPAHLRDPG